MLKPLKYNTKVINTGLM